MKWLLRWRSSSSRVRCHPQIAVPSIKEDLWFCCSRTPVQNTTNMRQREREGGGEDRERWKCTISLNPDDTQIINFLTFADLPFVHCRGIAAAWRTMFMHVRPRNTGSVNGTRIGKHSYLSLKKTSHVSIQEGKENWKCVSKSNFYTNIGLKIIKKFK